jgi:hypothetical protein
VAVKEVLASIEELSREFSKLTYFRLLEGPGARSDVEIMARGLSFFVMSFQDMLRLNAVHMTDPVLKQMAVGQRKDDSGHDRWFLNDLEKLRLAPDLRWLFSKRHQQTRDTSYEIIAQIFGASSDPARLVVGLSLEATGGVYFSRVHKFFARFGLGHGLRFFSQHHWDVEQSHALFEGEMQQQLHGIALTDAQRREALAAAARTFRAVGKMCEDLCSKMLKARLEQGLVSLVIDQKAVPGDAAPAGQNALGAE